MTASPTISHPTIEDLLRARVTRAFDVDPAGNVLAGDDATGSVQLYEIAPDGSRTQLTDLADSCTGRYLPGERRVVVQHDAGGNERGQLGLLQLDSTDTEIEPLVVDERYVHALLDVRAGLVYYATNRRNGVDFDIVVRDVAAGSERTVYDGGGWAMGVAVSPDDRWLVFQRPGSAANSAQLVLTETATGAVTEISAYDAPVKSDDPAWLPDSSGFVFSTDIGREYAAIARYDVAARDWKYIVTDDEHDLRCWLPTDGSRLLVAQWDDGTDHLTVHPVDGGEPITTIDIPAGSVATGRAGDPLWSADGSQLVLTITSPVEPGDIYRFDGSLLHRVTDSSDSLAKDGLVSPTSHRIPAPDGEQIPCFLYRPADGDGSVVVMVHGGPEAAVVRSWTPVLQALLSAGHAVAVPNVRGSTGYGRRWAALDDVRLRLDSVADLAAIHAWLPTVGLDPERAALYGGSYGGYMVLAGLTMQPQLWAAGVDIVGISSLVTFLENTSSYRRAAREREYGSLENDRDFLHEASPLTHIDAIRAPLFIIHGANDPRVPLSEAEQVAAAVRAAGAECELHVYSDEGHGLSKLPNKLDAYPRAIAFLSRHLARR